jgi:hypothetical protein
MDVFQPSSPNHDAATGAEAQVAAKFSTLGRGSDTSQFGPSRLLHFAAVVAGVVAALLVSAGGGMSAVWGKVSRTLSNKDVAQTSVAFSESDLDRQKPQRQAEILLERAIARSDDAQAQIESRVEKWRGRLKWDDQLSNLTTAALNSNDRNLQSSAIEVQLAAYGLTKSRANVDGLIGQADSSDHSKQIWAMWVLGLLANRGVETDRIVKVLTEHLKSSGQIHNDDSNSSSNSEEARRWAVEGLALVGTTPTIAPLLDAMHNDPSPSVRERAACSLAEAGMLSQEQRLIAVPQLIAYLDDPALDVQTRGWAFQALGDITHRRLPNDSAAWREWYQNDRTAN